MRQLYRGLTSDAKFEQDNLHLRRKLRQKIQNELIKYVGDKHYYLCNKALDKIYCANDMHYMLAIITSSRPKPLEYIIKCVNNMDARRYHRWSQEAFGFWYP
ncbi:hypothetical protein AKUH3B110M_02310 [Apilactobacillus kunkeei]|uniref:hypothetical protein n=1 Tax=Apilactobacillus kunkeei TaxID=148814 RepID=UPI00200A161A|nr:hypothetical protein [Apilactobacillus kunkeei]MCK8633588.1 hypothetical protein [Apilactobacillus kunkeei]CAI2562372.1 hypothetical protein AKUG0802_02300 [Apilactobacillus kunkeei]CAI2562789.1 hypothetical protein AKUH3B102A_02260 [Apilactobacillus kunkeei]CAI2562980.1 hypothetical protein AKUG0804_02310 [Apilactobacillus kunkeei]CAI2563020.1 hypothetical protein AKUG0405_02310 [Apilactobacillus kunkeei]